MNSQNKLRNTLIRKIQKLSIERLKELSKQISSPESKTNRETTLSLAGSWSNLSEDIFQDFTSNLHQNRSIDRSLEQLWVKFLSTRIFCHSTLEEM